jgi:hypothetical protein
MFPGLRHHDANPGTVVGYQFLATGKAAGDVKVLNGTQEVRLNY